MNKDILLASFIFPERIDWFVNHLHNKFNIAKEKVFIFENLDDQSKVIVTFKFTVSTTKRSNFKELFPNAILIHKKGNCIYTINALNKLIEEKCDGSLGNIDYKTIKIDWSEYDNKILLTNENNLNIYSIKRLF
jgi:hypothetical protein